ATIITLSIAVLGVAFGLYARHMWPTLVEWPVLKPVMLLFSSEFGLKLLYSLLARGGVWLVQRIAIFDHVVFDGFAGLITHATLALVRASGRFDVRRIDETIDDMGQGILALGQRVRAFQTGRIENYLLVVFLWGLGVIAVAVVATFVR
ncbi:MAG: hypothetical protein ABI396_03730, partial [Ktedonobacteraceae bacterium]